MIEISEEQDTNRTGNPLLIAVVAALVVSVGVLFLATSDALLTGVYGAGLIVLLLGALAFERFGKNAENAEPAQPDWSVTVAAIEEANEAIAITDRANRLVCANDAFIAAFGAENAPPLLDVERPELEALNRAAREAWRDGEGMVDDFLDTNAKAWSIRCRRAGRADDHLLWRFTPLRVITQEAALLRKPRSILILPAPSARSSAAQASKAR